ncbi:MAG: hypothetical protein ABI700_01595 [Chloroflexota bacterium]
MQQPSCPVGNVTGDPNNPPWDCEAVNNVFNLRDAFLNSASRHNRLPNMDNAGFAALLASIVVGERRIGRVPTGARENQQLEDTVASLGCVVSGKFVKDAFDNRDWGQFFNYLTNSTIPAANPIIAYASVGIGNMKLPTAANLWLGQACNAFGECTPVQINPLMTTNPLGMTMELLDPFTGVACTSGGNCASYNPDTIGVYKNIEVQLLQPAINIEYVAANLEAGALRAISMGITPTAFSSAIWHAAGTTTDKELGNVIQQYRKDPRGYASDWVLANMWVAQYVLGLTSTWQLDRNHEPAYCDWSGRC